MTTKLKLISGAVVVVAVFLAGFVPQYTGKRRAQTEFENTREELQIAQRQMEIDRLRTLAGRILLEASRQNYGTAAEYSTEYFNALRELQGKAQSDALKSSISTLLDARDSVTSDLAQGNPSIMTRLQSLLEGTYDLPDPERTVR